MVYRIEIISTAQRQILSLSRKAQIEVAQAIDRLANAPRPSRCRKLRGVALWRLRLGHYRVVYAIDDKASLVTVIKVALRREDTYQGL